VDVRGYWKKIRKLSLELSDNPLVVSVDDEVLQCKAGCYMRTSAYDAAKMIVDGYYRLATPEEEAEFEKKNSAKKEPKK
jgi:hypothetical protein